MMDGKQDGNGLLCPYCNSQLNEGSVYCPKCGREVQVISAVNDLEEEILRGFLSEDTVPDDVPEPEHRPAADPKPRSKKKKRKRRLRLLILLLSLAAAVLVVFGLVRYHQNHSTDYLLRTARQEYEQNDYDRALRHLDRLLALDGENIDGLLLSGDVYAAIPDYSSAESAYKRVIELDPSCAEAYEGLLTVYDAQGKREEILALKATVTDEEILALFDDFIPPSPEIKVKSGTYSDSVKVEIRAPKKGLTIYYTLDGTAPTQSDFLYSAPIEIDEEGEITLTAVCVDENGDLSEPVSEVYRIQFANPDPPVATPDGGQFDYPASVTVTAPAGTTVYYTWDNTVPGPGSSRYTGPITIPEGNNILSLVAIDERGKRSDVLKCNFIYYSAQSTETIDTSSYQDEEEEEWDEDWSEPEDITAEPSADSGTDATDPEYDADD